MFFLRNKFYGIINALKFTHIDQSLKATPILEFDKFKFRKPINSNVRLEDRDIDEGGYYSVEKDDKKLLADRYHIKLNNGKSYRLVVTKDNEKILKWLHGMYPIQKEPVKWATFIIGILTLISTIVLGM